MMKIKFICLFFTTTLVVSCSTNKVMVNYAADALTGSGSNSFASDEDPELIGDALPFALKVYESLLQNTEDNIELNLATGSAFIMYSNAYIHTPSAMLQQNDITKKKDMQSRAKKMYLRGFNYVLRGFDLKYNGIKFDFNSGNVEPYLAKMTKDDVPFLYWTAASYFGAYSLDPFDISMSANIKNAYLFMKKALELNDAFMDGAIHDFFISYYGSLPESLGGNDDKAKFHFEKAIEISKGKTLSPYISLAESVCVKKQDVKQYKMLLKKALDIDITKYPENRLANTINQRKAGWLLEHLDNKFISSHGD